jgi:hypothetical protein
MTIDIVNFNHQYSIFKQEPNSNDQTSYSVILNLFQDLGANMNSQFIIT